jgi:hypothetical protein
MNRRYRMRVRKRTLGSALAVLGVIVWAISATLRLAPDDHRDVSISHFEERSLGVIIGGASVVDFARHRRVRLYPDTRVPSAEKLYRRTPAKTACGEA